MKLLCAGSLDRNNGGKPFLQTDYFGLEIPS